MSEMNVKFYRYKITTLSPIHVGTGEEFLPTNSVISDDCGSQKDMICPECGRKIEDNYCSTCDIEYTEKESTSGEAHLHTFTSQELLSSLEVNQKTLFYNLCKQGDWSKIRDFFVNNADKIAKKSHIKATVSQEVYSDYKNMGKDAMFGIEKQFTDLLTQNPIIPGSSLKGSIRTALLNAKAKFRKCDNDKKLAQELLGYEKINEDPFKYFKISDAFSSAPITTRIIKQINNSRSNGYTLQPQGYAEIIPANSVFEGTICFNNAKDNNLRFAELFSACKEFYGKELAYEESYASEVVGDAFYKKLKNLSENRYLIRVGKHSGAECVTINGYRKIKIRKRGGYETKDHATTFWLSKDNNQEILPFGWAVMEISEAK
ncbi:MAG: hypothetical protein J6K16_03920 [Alphaproteobacteria bacterium]|nr:hypothetical protein [Alphaproteobacteria bacterium]